MFIYHFFKGSILKSTSMFYPKWMVLFNASDSEISVVYTAILAGAQIGGIIRVGLYNISYILNKKIFYFNSVTVVRCIVRKIASGG